MVQIKFLKNKNKKKVMQIKGEVMQIKGDVKHKIVFFFPYLAYRLNMTGNVTSTL